MTLQVLSRQTHKDLSLSTPAEPWAFARGRMIAGLVAPELPEVMKSMPIAFSVHENSANVVALLGLGDQNLFVGGQGEWLGEYIPAVLRAWPFALVQQDEHRVVGLDADSAAVTHGTGKRLFDDEGEPSEWLARTIRFLQSFSDQELVMARAVSAIRQAGLLAPWEFKARQSEGNEVKITGLHQIDRKAFEALPDEDFLALRREGALPVVYAHIFSQRNVAVLENLARRHQPAKAADAADAELDLPQALYITDDYLRF